MNRWLSIVGIGEEGLAGLGPAARRRIDRAETLVGGARHLSMVPEAGKERLTWPSPFSALVDELSARRGRRVCVLATGDPLHYGVGTTLVRHFSMDEMEIIPSPSAFSLACARLGWPLDEVTALTVHGRAIERLHPALQPGARLVVLSGGPETPEQIAGVLQSRGFGESRITVLEHMDGDKERRLTGRAGDWTADDVASFNTVAVECVAGPDAAVLPRTPGLPDEVFRHDGQLTKREVRAATLAALAPVPGQRLWDVGAGCGSIAVEWMRADPRCRAIAVERNRDRVQLIAENAAALGTPELEIVPGRAPGALEMLSPPDAVFIGGGINTDGLFESCWEALPPGGRLVANVVTLEGESRLVSLRETFGGSLSRIGISRAEPMGGFTGWKPLMPITQWSIQKR